MKKHLNKDIKKKAVEAHAKGMTITSLCETYDVHRHTLRNWIKRSKIKKGLNRKEGCGRPPCINPKEAQKLISVLKKPASQFGFESDFWTTKRIKIIMKKEFKKDVSIMAIHRTLVKFGQSYKKTRTKYYEACEKKQFEWKKKTVPKIKKILKKKRAMLYFEDESNISLSPVIAKTWSPIGKAAIQKVRANKGSVSAISALSHSGHLVFSLYTSNTRFKSKDIIQFLQKLLEHHKRRHIVVIMDRATCHTSKQVKKFIQEKKRLDLFYLPPRSPEFNPDEGLWSYLKNQELKAHKENTKKGLEKLTRRKLNKISNSKNTIKGILKMSPNYNLYV